MLNTRRSLQHAGHSWNPAHEQQGCVEGLTLFMMAPSKRRKSGGKTHEQPPRYLEPACVNEVVPVTRSEKKKRGLGTLDQHHVPAHWLVGFLISFFFFSPCLSFALSV